MSQVDFDITAVDANTGITMRAAINAALQALASNNSGATEPAVMYPYQFWMDTTTGTLNQRNADNTAWTALFVLSATQWTFVNDVLINGVTVGLGGGSLNTNTAIGLETLKNNTTGHHNTATGANSLSSTTTGYDNSAAGSNSLRANVTGYGNAAFGANAGFYLADGFTGNTQSFDSVFFGSYTSAGGVGNINEIVIGAWTVGAGSNTATLGNDSITKTVLKGVLKLNTVPGVHADNAAALAAGHVAGEIYRTATGVLMVVY